MRAADPGADVRLPAVVVVAVLFASKRKIAAHLGANAVAVDLCPLQQRIAPGVDGSLGVAHPCAVLITAPFLMQDRPLLLEDFYRAKLAHADLRRHKRIGLLELYAIGLTTG